MGNSENSESKFRPLHKDQPCSLFSKTQICKVQIPSWCQITLGTSWISFEANPNCLTWFDMVLPRDTPVRHWQLEDTTTHCTRPETPRLPHINDKAYIREQILHSNLAQIRAMRARTPALVHARPCTAPTPIKPPRMRNTPLCTSPNFPNLALRSGELYAARPSHPSTGHRVQPFP
jgi:hypothetical protein